jgi:DNA-binding transcriptional MerR regulator
MPAAVRVGTHVCAGCPFARGPSARRRAGGVTYDGRMKLRIDELAARAGTTSRNIRAHQARGLLPPPELEGRTGYYNEEHLQRLEMIDELQQRGYSLAGIAEMLDTWSQGGDLGHLIGFGRLITAPLSDEQTERVALDDILARFPEAATDDALVERAVELDLIRLQDDGHVLVPSPLLLRAGEELVRAGVPLAAILELVAAVRVDVADIADRFVGLANEHIVPSVTDDPEEVDLGDTLESLKRLRPIALEVVRPFLAQELQRSIQEAIDGLGAELDRVARSPEAS